MPSDAELWTENLPEIVLVDEDGNTVHAAAQPAGLSGRICLPLRAGALTTRTSTGTRWPKWSTCHPGYFSNLFRSEVGMSFSDYLIQVRIENAKSLLRRFDLSVEAISKKCGFNSLAHFSRTFKDRCGLSPLKFRKSPHAVN